MASSSESQDHFVLTPRHVSAARGLLQMTQAELAAAAGVDKKTIQSFEGGKHALRPTRVEAIKSALERRGVVFLNGDSPGVRLKSGAIIPV
jgi:DNA-binding XRE family transcriptional regulator